MKTSISGGSALLFRSGRLQGKQLSLPNKAFVIGRGDQCDLRIHSERVSRSHCELRPSSDGTIQIRDLGSRNGTFVNDQRLQKPVTLMHGDRIQVAGFAMEFINAASASSDNKTPLTADSVEERERDPTSLTIDELVRFDDDRLELESDRSPANADTISEAHSTDCNPTAPVPPKSHSPPPKETESSRTAARDALKQLFRGRHG